MGLLHAKEIQNTNKVQPKWKPLTEVQAKVEKVHIDGIKRTKEDVLSIIVNDLFKAQDFEEVLVKSQNVKKHLETLGAFKLVEILIDTSSGPGSSPDGFEVTFKVKEKRPILGNVNTLVGNNEGSILIGLTSPNIVGRGECFQVEYHYGTKRSSGFGTLFTKPHFGWLNYRTNAFLFGKSSDFPSSGFQEDNKGLGAELLFESTPKVNHALRWEGVWRNLKCLSAVTPFTIREEAGHSLKSSIKHILTADYRNHPILPSDGTFFQLSHEYAGLFGDVNYFKNEMHFQVNKLIMQDVVVQGSLMAGIVRTMGQDKSIRINDRFFLGGPLTIRGFTMNGIGPHDGDCALGAEVFWAAGAHLYAPLPFRPWRAVLDKICRTHIFVTCGNIGQFPFSHDYSQYVTMLLHNMRLSGGAGLVLSVSDVARFELNYCIPLIHGNGDKAHKGLQFGIGLSFL